MVWETALPIKSMLKMNCNIIAIMISYTIAFFSKGMHKYLAVFKIQCCLQE